MRDIPISLFFPCYNEEANVEATVRDALETCESLFSDYEIIIVDDGSRDRTGQIADRLAAEHDRVRAVHNQPNRGYGGALQRGFLEARKPWVFFTDGDGQFDIREIGLLVELTDRHDGVVGYRLDRQDSLMRKLNAWCWTTLCNCVFGMRFKDIDCAFKLLPRRLFDEIPLHSQGAMISAELLARATRKGYRIGQVGVHHRARAAGTPTGANPRVILRAFVELFKLRKLIIAGK
ncbi:MAG: glycosyltransferase family 2 protein [Planctomycetes bacterium]|nr:glycosyltransferase family 2 protein [Planctomycetota bacterium]